MKRLAAVLFMALSCNALGALPPSAQNIEDLEVMVSFVKQHRRIAAQLKRIDVEQHTVYFGSTCRALFQRKLVTRPQGWVGPAAPLQFKAIDCPDP